MLKVLADKTRLVFFARGRMTAEAGTQRINHDENERVSRRKKIASVRFIGCNVSVRDFTSR